MKKIKGMPPCFDDVAVFSDANCKYRRLLTVICMLPHGDFGARSDEALRFILNPKSLYVDNCVINT